MRSLRSSLPSFRQSLHRPWSRRINCSSGTVPASSLLLPSAHRSTPGTCDSRSVSGACVMERCSPRSASFPSQPPPKVALLCSAGSSVLRRSPTAPGRACPPFGLWPSRTGLAVEAKTSKSSLGSRACCFSACAGSKTTQDRASHSRFNVTVVLPSSSRNGVGVLYQRLFEAQ